jgi:serine/threonine protein kinase
VTVTEVGIGAGIGRYRLEELLGRGGMGEVWRAFDTGRERWVALKLLLESLAQDAEFVARFRREARLAARLSDPHILPIHDFGELEGRLYIDMRMVDGPDLAKVVSRGPVPPDRTAAIVSQIASALDAAHAGGLVHRDVKPANVLLAARDPVFAYLTDFGVAAEQNRSDGLTQAGTVIGTLAYMAPETFEGIPPGPSSDVYALGCVLAEMLLGHPPYKTSTPVQALRAHVHEPVPRPSERDPRVPKAFDDVVARAMAKDPARRYRSAGEIGAALLDAASGSAPRPSSSAAPGPTTAAARPASGATAAARPASGATAAAPAPSMSTEAGAREGPARTVVTRLPPPPTLEVPPPQPGRWPLRPDYQATPGPLRYPSPLPFLGHQHVVDDIRQRLRFSPGGSLLVTGTVGAGKTTVVARALDELHTELVSTTPEPTPVVVVWESLVRPVSPEELVARLIRGLGEALERAGIVARLPPEVAELLDAARRRTFAPFALADAERDVVALLSALATRAETTPSRRWFRRGGAEPWSGRVVVVLDDVHELTADGPGMASFENLLRALRNVLTATAAHFVVVAGVEALDIARRSETRGGSIWSAVFGRQIYLDSLPRGAAVELLRSVLITPGVEYEGSPLADHLEYRSRGIPRLLLGELDALVEWHPDGPHVVVDQARAVAIAVHAALERRVGPLWAQSRPRGPLAHHLDIDRRRSATYLVVAWALDRRGTSFTASDLVADLARDGHSRDLASDDECVGLLRELAATGILRAREPDSPRATFVGTPGPGETVYRLSRTVADAVARTGPAPRELGRVGDGRYVLLEELGRGVLGRTYRAQDTYTTRDVAITLLDVREQHDDVARERFRRGVDLARRLEHPLLAESLGTLEDAGRLGLVSEFVPGLGLDELLERGPLAPEVAVDLTLGLLDLMHHLHGAGVVRLDLTPSHVVITPDGRPVVVGLGPAHRADAEPPAGVVLGTPLYLSPEALAGRPVDVRSDLYSLGLILVEMLTAQPARHGSVATIIAQAATRSVDLATIPGSPELRTVLEALLDPEPDARFADPAELAAALATVPERQ